MRQYFSNQLAETGIALAPADRRRLVDDLVEMAVEEYDVGDPTSCVSAEACELAWHEWLRRLGGTRNITAYVATLAAGELRRQQVAAKR